MTYSVSGNYQPDAVEQAIATLLWSETDDSGNPLEDSYDADDVTSEVRKFLIEQLSGLFEDERVLEIIQRHKISAESFGHDFVLTANGHGAGFWDRGHWDDGEYLTEMVKPAGPINLFVTTKNMLGMN